MIQLVGRCRENSRKDRKSATTVIPCGFKMSSWGSNKQTPEKSLLFPVPELYSLYHEDPLSSSLGSCGTPISASLMCPYNIPHYLGQPESISKPGRESPKWGIQRWTLAQSAPQFWMEAQWNGRWSRGRVIDLPSPQHLFPSDSKAGKTQTQEPGWMGPPELYKSALPRSPWGARSGKAGSLSICRPWAHPSPPLYLQPVLSHCAPNFQTPKSPGSVPLPCSHVGVVFQSLSHVWLCATPWTAARQAYLSFTIS